MVEASAPQAITVTTYNIHKGMSALNRLVQIEGIAHALQRINPDILLLQEVQGQHIRRSLRHHNFPRQAQHEYFGDFLAYAASYGKNAEHPGRHHGNAVLSRFDLHTKNNMNISVNRLEQRGVLHCEVTPPGWDRPLVCLCVHLNLRERDRLKQYLAIREYVTESIDPALPLVLAGDFNDWQHRSCDELGQQLQMHEVFIHHHGRLPKTFPAKIPMLCLDRIYVRHLDVVAAHAHNGAPFNTLSDHLPLSAELRLKAA